MRKKQIVVMGFMAGMPIAGVGLAARVIDRRQRLGHEVYCIEGLSRYPYDPVAYTATDDYSYAAKTLAKLATQFGFEEALELLRALSAGLAVR